MKSKVLDGEVMEGYHKTPDIILQISLGLDVLESLIGGLLHV